MKKWIMLLIYTLLRSAFYVYSNFIYSIPTSRPTKSPGVVQKFTRFVSGLLIKKNLGINFTGQPLPFSLKIAKLVIACIVMLCCTISQAQNKNFVEVQGHQFFISGEPYYYIGTNYWYGSLLGLHKNEQRGRVRLYRELDFLASKGVTNLRVMVGAEGSGLINGVERVNPSLQSSKGIFNVANLDGLDLLLYEMGKRNMKAVLFLSNNWEWSGGFLQYLNWNGLLADSVLRRKLSWDEMRDYVSRFYTCTSCKEDYKKQVELVITRTNKITRKKYKNDPAIMAWELANEPRPMRPASNIAYAAWIEEVAAFIKSKDKNHLVTLGNEGEIGTESPELFKQVHAGKNVDYLTIHIWPKNWSWFTDSTFEKDLPQVIEKTQTYIQKHVTVAQQLDKPLVIEEFGLPRNEHSFDIGSATGLRDSLYHSIFSTWQDHSHNDGVIAGVNFWAYGGSARPIKDQVFWKAGDDYMGDPPMEEQGLNSVFNSDTSTWQMIYSFTSGNKPGKKNNLPSDRNATSKTIALYQNLKVLMNKGVMFGHQDDMAYGVEWRYQDKRSDVKDLVGDYPAVHGWELGNMEHNLPYNLDSVPFDKMKHFIQQVYQGGGVNTISWHLDNPLNGASAWDTTHGGVAAALPGGDKHQLYKTWLDNVAVFLQGLTDKKGAQIPILFRPFHEFTGNWFWWCQNTCTPAEFKLLWRFTVDYMRNVKGLHQLLYVYNTAGFNSKEEFLERYPGDDVVDIVSFDAYQHNDPQVDSSFMQDLDHRLNLLTEIARERSKIAALAETGYEKIPYKEWWTKTLWAAISPHPISYVLVWRNHGLQENGNWHYYVPKKNDVSTEDFKAFYNLEQTLFEKDVKKEQLYKHR